MKKLMKKKVNVFGKTFSMFAIAMVAVIGLGAAALVPYLSNTVTGSASVDSPVELSIAAENATTNTPWANGAGVPSTFENTNEISLSPAYGGETKGFWVKAQNLANARTDGFVVFNLAETSEGGLAITGEEDNLIGDFDATVTVYDWNQHAESGLPKRTYQLDAENSQLIQIVNNTDGSVKIIAPSYLFENGNDGDTIYFNIEMNFESNAIGTYEFEAAFMEDPQGNFPSQ